MPYHHLTPSAPLPNIETFRSLYADCPECGQFVVEPAVPISGVTILCPHCKAVRKDIRILLSKWGWFYWYCMPGCLPDSEPIGVFTTEAEALEHARQDAEE
jgi:hypothetical protein